MTVMSRRALLANILPGAVAAAGIASVGLSLIPSAASAMPVDVPNPGQTKPDDLVEKAQFVVHSHRRGRYGRRHGGRRWVCWWQRGRQICGWR
ncbi:MAG TPA: hypothetical protein VGC26_08815 [Afipia sp.]